MSTFSPQIIVERLTAARLASYLEAADGDVQAAISLYDWGCQPLSRRFHNPRTLAIRDRFEPMWRIECSACTSCNRIAHHEPSLK